MKDSQREKTPHLWRVRRIHLIGIGGSGMSGIAEVLLNLGYEVSGSDLTNSASVQRLKKRGANVFIGHSADNVAAADVVVASSAINHDNPEVSAAKVAHIPVVPRAEMLAELMRFQRGIAVAGTHGKTTTTSLIASMLAEADLDPTFVIGGVLNGAGANARLGKGPFFVAEADESDASFLHLHPLLSVVTNIDADHLSTYDNDFEALKQTFISFLQKLPFYGLAILCADDPVIQSMMDDIARPIITYGLSEHADVRAVDVSQEGMQSLFTVLRPEKPPLPVVLNLPGTHNVLNALAAITVVQECQAGNDAILKALRQFEGIGRRCQVHGEYETPMGSIMLIDDYGHHPREVSATLQALRAAYPSRRLVMAYQPHRYTRTAALFDDFVNVLSEVDALLLLQVYSAGEMPIVGADSQALCSGIRKRGQLEPIFVEALNDLGVLLPRVLQDNDILLCQGAGSIGSLASKLASAQLAFTAEDKAS